MAVFLLRGHGPQVRESAASQDRQNPSENPSKAPAIAEVPIDKSASSHTADQASNSNITSGRSFKLSRSKSTAVASNSVRLRDGRNNIVIDRGGNISGFEKATRETRVLVKTSISERPREET